MGGFLSGLEKFGLGNLNNKDIYAKKEEKPAEGKQEKEQEPPKIQETDLIYDKTFACPVCDDKFTAKIMKTGRAKMIGSDFDLRPKYEGIDAVKYEVLLCPHCGYAALGRYFSSMLPAKAKLIKENISAHVKVPSFPNDIYTYDEALVRFDLALASSVVKRAKSSEIAYVCLKRAWVKRGYLETLEAVDEKDRDAKRIKELQQGEYEDLNNAYKGFIEARSSESFPIAGMDEITVDYLLAQLANYLKDYDVALRLVGGILTSSSANSRIKDKARDLKEQIVKNKQEEEY